MRLPDFLIIGAMKSGTTTLFEDLSTSPEIFFPADKEPGNLTDDRVLTASGLREYAALFERAGLRQKCGDASTAYTKLPDIQGCAARATAVFQQPPKLIYLVREPLSRAISHYRHEFGMKTISGSIDSAVRSTPSLIEYSRYAAQLGPWLEAFGRASVLVVRFEDYVTNRLSHLRRIAAFIGIDPAGLSIDPQRRFNDSSDKVVATGLAARFVHSRFYRSWIRPRFDRGVRQRVARILLPRPPVDFAPPSTATVDFILERVAPDVVRLQEILGADRPLWNLDEVRSKYVARAESRA